MLSITKQMFITAAHFKAMPDYCSFISARESSPGYSAVNVPDPAQQTKSMELPPSGA